MRVVRFFVIFLCHSLADRNVGWVRITIGDFEVQDRAANRHLHAARERPSAWNSGGHGRAESMPVFSIHVSSRPVLRNPLFSESVANQWFWPSLQLLSVERHITGCGSQNAAVQDVAGHLFHSRHCLGGLTTEFQQVRCEHACLLGRKCFQKNADSVSGKVRGFV